MKFHDVHAALPTSESPVWTWGAVVTFVLAVLPDILRALTDQHDVLGIPDAVIRWFQIALIILGIVSAKMGDAWAKRAIWSDEQRVAFKNGGGK